ncbi:MAG: hypothetical protein QHI48_10180 [Bacteroidota bacterium]|nr:hypothetical protein [Bacteroidota bacterium]
MKRSACITLSVLLVILVAEAGAQRTTSLSRPRFPRLALTDLSAELGLPRDMLPGFGMRVDIARRLADADALAAEAVLLAFAEEVAGKTAATITSLAILEEAARIAGESREPSSIRAVEVAAARVNGGERAVTLLRETMAMVPERRGEGNFVGYVRVINRTGRLLDVYIDGKYSGFLSDEEERLFSTGHGTTVVRVMDAFGNTAEEIVEVRQEDTLTWTVNP